MTSGKKLFKDTRFDGELAKCSCGGDAVVVNSGKIPLRFRVLYCESRRPPPFECGLREGVDYFVERAEE
jgi:hypothetical protein